MFLKLKRIWFIIINFFPLFSLIFFPYFFCMIIHYIFKSIWNKKFVIGLMNFLSISLSIEVMENGPNSWTSLMDFSISFLSDSYRVHCQNIWPAVSGPSPRRHRSLSKYYTCISCCSKRNDRFWIDWLMLLSWTKVEIHNCRTMAFYPYLIVVLEICQAIADLCIRNIKQRAFETSVVIQESVTMRISRCKSTIDITEG